MRIVGVPHQQAVQVLDELGLESRSGSLDEEEVDGVLVAGELALAAIAERHGSALSTIARARAR